MPGSDFDAAAGHRHFSAGCFNKAWEYIDNPRRTAEEDEQMLLCALASLWHWTQRGDCGDMQRSIGHWQISRVYCLLGKFEESLHHASRCLHHSQTLSAFYKTYAHEAFARAYSESIRLRPMPGLGNNEGTHARLNEHLVKARMLLREIADDMERHMVEADLATIKEWEY